MGKTIGIDLGTTNTCVATMMDGKPIVIPSSTGNRLIPSYFAITGDDKELVGVRAKRQSITNPKNTIFAAKRLIGRRYDSKEVQLTKEKVSYEIVKGPHDDARVVCGGKTFSIPEISAFILLEAKNVAQAFLKDEIEGVCITVPAYFNENQRQATVNAAEIAGLKVLRIINEPTASALAYSQRRRKSKELIVVYDFGGGTFDVSILEFGEGVYEVLATAGNTYLGGEDIDNRLLNYVLSDFEKNHKIDLRKDTMAMQRLKDAVEGIKIELSFQPEATLSLPFLTETSHGAIHYNTIITRSKLEELIYDLVEQTLQICSDALKNAKLSKNEIDEVILVGGQTRTPLVLKKVAEFFGKQPNRSINPDEVVAEGAAIHAYNIVSPLPSNILVDITALSLGIQTRGGKFTEIIPKNTAIPVTKTRRFTTTYDNQDAVRIAVYQGNEEMAEDNELLGEFVLSGIRLAKKGEPNIEVSFDMNSEGLLKVTARDVDLGTEQTVTLEASNGLSAEELVMMRKRMMTLELELKKQ
ncbi:MAG: molecular chaperone DnaK [bacterium]